MTASWTAAASSFPRVHAPLSCLALFAILGATAGACGGKVTVDESSGGSGTGATGSGASATGATGTGASGTGASGTGGTGNSGTSTGTSTVTATSTGTGVEVCDCDFFCGQLLDCGFEPPGGCDNICNQVPQQAKDCVCEAASCQEMAQDCFQGPGGGGGGGGGGLQQCFNCINDVGVFGCEPAIDQCLNNPSCETMLDCNSQCGWTPQCAGQCAAMNPAGALDFANMMGCLSCGSCIGQCAPTPLGNYCLDG